MRHPLIASRRVALVSALWLGALSLTAAVAPGGSAQDSEKTRAVRRGEVLYQLHCQTCHGREATGNGPLAEHLRVAPANLRELSSRVGGYSEEWLAHVIDGRAEVRAHGSREMPVWGVGFYEPARAGDQEADIRARIGDLVAYLVSIQEPRERSP